jgi:ribose transport system ATP-binding protein
MSMTPLSTPPAEVPGSMGRSLLSIRNLSKVFGGTQALAGVNLEVAAGEVHGLVGENGSGKSTLIKILCGYHPPEPGADISIGGQRVSLPLPAGQLSQMGMRFVHQDLGLVPTLSVAENLFVDELTAQKSRRVTRRSAEVRRARGVLAPFGRDIDPCLKVGALPPADQAHVAVVRAVSQLRQRRATGESAPGLLVLDEVTAFLPSEGRAQLFELIREIVAGGDSVLFVSHYLDEVLEITSRVSVLRDGHLVDTVDTSALDSERLVELIIGRTLRGELGARHSPAADDGRSATVTGLVGSSLQSIDFDIRRGEILGVTGLLGSGFEEIPSLLFGAKRANHGRLHFAGRTVDLRTLTPARARHFGIALVPGDRASAGAVGALTVAENLTLQVMDHHSWAGILQRRDLQRHTVAALEEYDVRPRNPKAKLATLSGGNQQKVILAKWLSTEPDLLLLDEPTLGVDVGSREDILVRIRAVARGGVAVLCASNDPEQLSELCDRVLIFARGQLVAELVGDDLNKDAITDACYSASIQRDSNSARSQT